MRKIPSAAHEVPSASALGLDLVEIQESLKHCRGFPLRAYVSPEIFEFELRAIFEGTWQYFAPLSLLAHPGDVVTGIVGTTPVLVTRRADGVLNGFVNACRHRGYSVARGDARGCARLVCGYHGWSYRLDGSLAAAPDFEDEPNFDARNYGLIPVSVDVWGPTVFVNTQPDAAPLHECMPEIRRFSQERGFIEDPQHYELVELYTKDQAANWKLWYDNGVECYHCAVIHPRSFFLAFRTTTAEKQDSRRSGKVMSSNFEAPPVAANSDRPEATYCRSLWPFPGGQLVQQDDVMVLGRMIPTGPESCRFSAHMFAERGADPKRVAYWIDLYKRTYDEDAAAVEIQQRNLRSAHVPPFRYSSKREAPVMYINQLIYDAYRASLESSSTRTEPR